MPVLLILLVGVAHSGAAFFCAFLAFGLFAATTVSWEHRKPWLSMAAVVSAGYFSYLALSISVEAGVQMMERSLSRCGTCRQGAADDLIFLPAVCHGAAVLSSCLAGDLGWSRWLARTLVRSSIGTWLWIILILGL